MARSGQTAHTAARTAAAPGRRPAGGIYLLVHPERFPSNDWDAAGLYVDNGGFDVPPGVVVVDPDDLKGFDERYGAVIAERAGGCRRRICLLDESILEEYQGEYAYDDELTVGLPLDGWELVACEPHQVGHVVRRLLKDEQGPALVAGYARRDCVARALAAARKLGLDAELHEPATLPLTPAAARTLGI